MIFDQAGLLRMNLSWKAELLIVTGLRQSGNFEDESSWERQDF